jgi:hypothetical protein
MLYTTVRLPSFVDPREGEMGSQGVPHRDCPAKVRGERDIRTVSELEHDLPLCDEAIVDVRPGNRQVCCACSRRCCSVQTPNLRVTVEGLGGQD